MFFETHNLVALLTRREYMVFEFTTLLTLGLITLWTKLDEWGYVVIVVSVALYVSWTHSDSHGWSLGTTFCRKVSATSIVVRFRAFFLAYIAGCTGAQQNMFLKCFSELVRCHTCSVLSGDCAMINDTIAGLGDR